MGSAEMTRHAVSSVGQAVQKTHFYLAEQLVTAAVRTGEAGESAAAWSVRRDENPTNTRPRRVRSLTGKVPLPPARERPFGGAWGAPNVCQAREVCWVLRLGSASILGSRYTTKQQTQAGWLAHTLLGC